MQFLSSQKGGVVCGLVVGTIDTGLSAVASIEACSWLTASSDSKDSLSTDLPLQDVFIRGSLSSPFPPAPSITGLEVQDVLM